MYDAAIFREYDVRGRAPELLSPDVARGVARALGTRIRRAGGKTALVGRDVRHSSPALAAAAASGLAECGLLVRDLGIVPTPVLYHALHRVPADGGVMVTGSHNPKSDNGLKVCLGTESLWGGAIRSLRDEALRGDFATGAGRVEALPYAERYLADLLPRFSFRKRFKLAVDCGNGVMGPLVLEAFGRLGFEVVPLYCDQDGDFPNHIPDPEVPAYMETLRKTVVSARADAGLGFDGDGDRVGVVDEQGVKISADHLIAVFADAMLPEFPGGIIRYDVKCGDFLDSWIRARGGIPRMGKTGHSLLKRDLKAEDAIFGGELSGHLVFNRGYLPIDDSLYAALRLLELADRRGGAVSALFAAIPKAVSTAEIKLPCPDARKFQVVADLVAAFKARYEVNDLDGARVRLPGGWFLVRASNTTPNLTVRLEAATRGELLRVRDALAEALGRHPEVDAAPLSAV
jgi:phosphomannomutase/phosphoglucomutase